MTNPSSAEPPETNGRLMGWKEIGAYLGRSARTVQRWELELDMPVHRIRTDHEGFIVFAVRTELDTWMAARAAVPTAEPTAEPATPALTPEPAARRWSAGRPVAVAAGLALVLMLGWSSGWLRPSTGAAPVPAGLSGIDRPLIYLIANTGVAAYDERTETIVREFPLPADAPFTSLHGGRLSAAAPELRFATRGATGTVIFDLPTETWRDWTSLSGGRLTQVDTNGAGTSLVIDQDGRALLLDRDTRRQVASVMVPVETFDVVARGDVNHFLVASRDSGVVSVIDSSTRVQVSTLRAGDSVGQIVLSADGARLYATNHLHDRVSCVDLASGVVDGSTPVGTRPWALTLAPDGRTLYVVDRDSDSISVVATATCEKVASIEGVFGGGQLGALTLGSQGTRLYVAAYHTAQVAVFDVAPAPTYLKRRASFLAPTTLSGMVASPAAR